MFATASKVPWPLLLKLAGLILLIVFANHASGWLADALRIEIRPSNEDLVHRMIMLAAGLYALLLAIPFVPGMEIGLALIGLLGPPIVLLVYLCTLLGLTMSYLVGRLIPLSGLASLFEDLNLVRASALLKTIEPMNREQRLAFLLNKAPNRFVPFLLRHRYIALALVLNVPGNVLIGGGGGIALIAGLSRLYSTLAFLVCIALAVAPVPIAVLLFGDMVLPG